MTRVRVIAAALAVALAACGGGGGTTAKTPGGSVSNSAVGGERTTITIYRDGAIVRDLRTMNVPKGTSQVVFENVPRTADARSAHFGSLSHPDTTRAVAMRYESGDVSGPSLVEELIGHTVTLGEGDDAVTGVLRSISGEGAVLETGNPNQPLSLVSGTTMLRTPLSDDAITSPRMAWQVESDEGGEQLLQAAYITTGISWDAGYNLILDESGDTAWLQGWLSVRNDSGAAFEGADIYVVDAPMHPVLVPVAPAYDPYAYNEYGYDGDYGGVQYDQYGNPIAPTPAPEPKKKKKTGDHAVRAAIDVSIPSGASHQYALIGEIGHGLASAVELLYDPLGPDLNTKVRVPVSREEFGETDVTEVRKSIEIDLGSLGLDGTLPAGRMRVFQRGKDGALTPVGEADVFGDSDEDEDDGGKKGNKLRLAIGLAPEVVATRKQTDFSVDQTEKRLVEQVTIELENKTDVDAKVIVDEHMYRGLNWVLAYHNEVGTVSKEGKQDVRWRVVVPAKAKLRVIYRVVYSW